MKNRTVYKLVKKNGDEERVNSKKVALTKYNSSDYHGGNPWAGVIRQRQEKSKDGFFYTKKTTVLRNRSAWVADKYRIKAEGSSMEFEVE
ncbi:MAG: hypothetical protein ABEJ56_05600 [Candidatus Nanohaloarchaea archaeon]